MLDITNIKKKIIKKNKKKNKRIRREGSYSDKIRTEGKRGRKNLFDVALREVEDALVFARNRNERASTSIPKLGVEGDISICRGKKRGG